MYYDTVIVASCLFFLSWVQRFCTQELIFSSVLSAKRVWDSVTREQKEQEQRWRQQEARSSGGGSKLCAMISKGRVKSLKKAGNHPASFEYEWSSSVFYRSGCLMDLLPHLIGIWELRLRGSLQLGLVSLNQEDRMFSTMCKDRITIVAWAVVLSWGTHLLFYDWNRIAVLAEEAIHVSHGKTWPFDHARTNQIAEEGMQFFYVPTCHFFLKLTCTPKPSLEVFKAAIWSLKNQPEVHFLLNFFKNLSFTHNQPAVRFSR